jgi:hypothetical protein
MTMPTPPSKPDSPPVTPKVCDCGYDLTGLPSDASAQCPECGAVIAELHTRRASFLSVPMLAFATFGPTAVLAGLIVWEANSYDLSERVIEPSGITVILFVWFAFGSIPAFFELVRVTHRRGSVVHAMACVMVLLVLFATAFVLFLL